MRKDEIEFGYKILERIVILGTRGGWTKELNFIRWNNKSEVYDIREWNEDHTRMTIGVTMTSEELLKLKEALETHEIKESAYL